jgi:hypothetical protein
LCPAGRISLIMSRQKIVAICKRARGENMLGRRSKLRETALSFSTYHIPHDLRIRRKINSVIVAIHNAVEGPVKDRPPYREALNGIR